MTNGILISFLAYQKMFAYAKSAKDQNDSEVGGLLQIKELEDGGLLLEDVVLPEQTASCGSFEAKQSGKWLKELTPEQIPKLKGFWHSHHNMGTFHSGVDDDTLGDKWDGESKNGCYYGVSIVVAFPNKIQAYLQYYKPVKTTKIDLPVEILYPDSADLLKRCADEVKEKVKKYQYDWKKEEANTQYPYFRSETDGAVEKAEKGKKQNLEELVIDPLSGRTLAQIKEDGDWDPALFPDLVEALEDLEIEHYEDGKWEDGEVNGTMQLNNPSKCSGGHLCKTPKQDWMCIIHGKNYDCAGCKFNLLEKESKEELESEDPEGKNQAIVPLTSAP